MGLDTFPSQVPAGVVLDEGEEVEVSAVAAGATIVVTDRRLLIAAQDRLLLDMPFGRLRRIEFDIEKARPAALVVVPDRPVDAAHVLSIAPEHYPEAALAISAIGRRLNELPS